MSNIGKHLTSLGKMKMMCLICVALIFIVRDFLGKIILV